MVTQASPPPASERAATSPGDVPVGLRVLAETPTLTWIDLDDPRSSELDALAARFGFHELAVEDTRHRRQLAKLDEFPDHLFLIANTIRYDEDTSELEVRELDMFVGDSFIVTVHQGPSRVVDGVAVRSATDARIRTPADVLYQLLDAIVDRFIPTLDAIGMSVDEIEDVILEQLDPACLSKIFTLKHSLVSFRRAAAAQRELLNMLTRLEPRFLPQEMRIYFRDIYDHNVVVIELIESYRDLLSGALEIYLTQTANRTNEIVKAVTIIATILLPLTVITSWYGMNVPGLPFADDPHGVWYITGGLALVVFSSLAYFKNKGWI